MKALAATIFAFFTVSHALALPSTTLIEALVKVESMGSVHSVGDDGDAIGCLQIHKEVVDDVNRKYGTSYTYDDRKCPVKSREMCKKYLIMHGGRNATSEKYARIWNGGPRGHRLASTKSYWRRVRAVMTRGI